MSDSNSTVGGHTPGPWFHRQVFNGQGELLHDFIEDEGGEILADVSDPLDGPLFAAAPDLKDAGVALLAAAERHIFGDECKAERDAMRAAIAKAIGGQS